MLITLAVVLQVEGEPRLFSQVVDRGYDRVPVAGELVAYSDHPESLGQFATVELVWWMTRTAEDRIVPVLFLRPRRLGGPLPSEEQLRAWGYTAKDDSDEDWPWPGVEPFTLG